jgi:ribosomal protein S18 acetylase RimI-like enzyme
MRDCSLWHAGVDEPISGLNVLSFRQRFGAVSIPTEGIGGVETLPSFRRRGYVSKLLIKAIEGIARRVPIVFVSEAIEDLYEKFGFVNCVAEAYLSVPVRNVERATVSSPRWVRSFSQADLPAMVALYNEVHAHRPWTHDRHAGWNRLLVTQTWQPGSEAIILERDERLAGYAILKEPQYGHVVSSFVVDELTAIDVEAAQALLVEVAARCWHMRFSECWVREPLDSAVGKAARRIGCAYHRTFPRSGGMMGAILDRQQLLPLLEPELRRRLPSDDLRTAHTTAFDALCRGEVVSDPRDLLRLLVGYWSTPDARAYGTVIPTQYERVVDAWFPGGGTQVLPLAYAHTLDRY